MKKAIIILLLPFILLSCGPKRAKCYSKRCVETTIKKDVTKSPKANS